MLGISIVRTCPTCKVLYPAESQFCPADGTALQDAPAAEGPGDLVAGTMVGEYRVTDKIGEGGMGSVYASVHPVIGKKAAIKLLNPSLATDPGAVARFISEARSVNHIQHPNIVDIFSFGQLDDGRHYFVMELLEGKTLKEELDQGSPMSISRAMNVLWQVCDALEAAHARGIYHRDLKPDNIYLTERPTTGVFAKLLDFGIAKLTGEAGQGLSRTRTGVPMGTPYYMSPEQCRGVGVDQRTDIYSLGVIMYEIFTGRLPFTGASYIDVIQAHLSTPPMPPTELVGTLPRPLSEIILRSMAKAPEERYSSVGGVKAELERVSRELGDSLGPAARVDMALTTPVRPDVEIPTPSFAVPGTTLKNAEKPRARSITMVVGGVVATAVAVAFLVMFRSGPAEESESFEAPTAAQAAPSPPPPVPPPKPKARPVAPVPQPARLVLAASPAATLTVGNEVHGTGAQFSIEVEPGKHELTLQADGYEPHRETFDFPRGGEVTRAITLEKISRTAHRGRRRSRRLKASSPAEATTAPTEAVEKTKAPAKTGDATLDPFK